MKKGQWTKTDAITESDIAVIIDINMEIFWFWEGSHSTARDRYNARQILGQLRKKYTTYRFKRINEKATEEVRDTVEILQIHALARKKSEKKSKLKHLTTIVHSISFLNSALTIVAFILLTGILFQSEVISSHLTINQFNFIFRLGIISLISLTSFILFIFSAIYMGILRNKLLMGISIIGCCLIFVPFFMLRIWDILLIKEIINEQILIQNDAILFFIFIINMFFILSIICSLSTGIMGLMKITLIKKTEEDTMKD